jgi:K+-sensing histidine kinase KdpD
MSDEPHTHAAYEPHPWIDLTPDEILDRVIHDLYTPVSALGGEIDRLASGAFEDDELLGLLAQIRENINLLGRLVVTLKQYVDDRGRIDESGA